MNSDERASSQRDPSSEPPPREAAAPAAGPLEALRRKAAEFDQVREQLLRARADYANLEKRQARAMEAYRRHALQDFAATLLPGLDDLERALQSARETEDLEALRAGVEMALKALQKALSDAGIQRITTEGEPFDPALHDAVIVEADPGREAATVAQEIRGGYVLGDRVVRPAQVKVAVPPPAAVEPESPPKRPAGEVEGADGADV